MYVGNTIHYCGQSQSNQSEADLFHKAAVAAACLSEKQTWASFWQLPSFSAAHTDRETERETETESVEISGGQWSSDVQRHTVTD